LYVYPHRRSQYASGGPVAAVVAGDASVVEFMGTTEANAHTIRSTAEAKTTPRTEKPVFMAIPCTHNAIIP